MGSYQVLRRHEIAMGHRVYGHEGKCRNPHGHNYVFEFVVEGDKLDSVGRVIDFGKIKEILCEWLEENWDHRFMAWSNDPLWVALAQISDAADIELGSVVVVPFNPTVENIAQYFVEDIAPGLLLDTGTTLTQLRVWETGKCSTIYTSEGKRNDGTTGSGRERRAEVLR